MQNYMYEKAMAPATRNGGTSTLNNNGVDNSKRKLLIALDIFCLVLGECPTHTQIATMKTKIHALFLKSVHHM